MPHQLFLTGRQKTKVRNVFADNISMHIKLIKVQISKLFNQVDLLILYLEKQANLGKKEILNYGVPLAKDVCLN